MFLINPVEQKHAVRRQVLRIMGEDMPQSSEIEDISLKNNDIIPAVSPAVSTAVSTDAVSAGAPLTREDLVPYVSMGMSDALATAAEAGTAGESAQANTLVEPASKVPADFDRSEAVVLDKPVKNLVSNGPMNGMRGGSTTNSTVLWPVKKDLLGVEVSITTYEEAARIILASAKRGESALVTFFAVHAVVTAATDPAYRYRINAFDMVAPDGQPVRWAMNYLHKAKMPERVCGPVTMPLVCGMAAEEGVGIYLYGSTNETLKKLKANLEDRFPGLRVVGMESPPFRSLSPEENEAACERINATGAGLVFIGLGCPRQDIFAHTNRNRIKGVQLCVGAAFDFHAGNKQMAPEWMQRCGLEWTYRMLQEPRRLFKRYLITNSQFIYLMARRVMTGK